MYLAAFQNIKPIKCHLEGYQTEEGGIKDLRVPSPLSAFGSLGRTSGTTEAYFTGG